MKTSKRTMISPSVETRLAAYAAAGVALAMPALAPTAHASVVFSSPTLNLAVPQNPDGVYLDLTTGATGASAAAVPGFDINMYGTTTLTWYFGADVDPNNGGAYTGPTGTPANKFLLLQAGATVGPANLFSGASSGGAGYNSLFLAPGATGYLGMRFTNDNTGAINYGYIHFKNTATTGATGYPATIIDYAYENTGLAITIVPEPTTNAVLGLGALALGAASVRRWRKDKQQAVG